MNFKSIGFKAAIATAVVAGSAMSMAPAQAGAISGSVTFGGQNELKSVKGNTISDFSTIVFNDGILKISAGTGSFSSFVGGTATFLSKTIQTNQTNLNNFITFKTANADPSKIITFNLTAFLDSAYTEIGSELNPKKPKPDNNGQFQSRVSGFLNPGSKEVDNTNSPFNAFKFNNSGGDLTNVTSITLATIPTPALLPGLIGMGVAALRKRKSEESEVEAAETAKA